MFYFPKYFQECDSCDKVFRRKDSLTTHKLRAHCVNPEELKTYVSC